VSKKLTGTRAVRNAKTLIGSSTTSNAFDRLDIIAQAKVPVFGP
jgi:hypothetical protein